MKTEKDEKYLQEIGGKIRTRREKLKYSLMQLATKASLSKGQLYKIEVGSNATTILVLRRIAVALEVKIGVLVDE